MKQNSKKELISTTNRSGRDNVSPRTTTTDATTSSRGPTTLTPDEQAHKEAVVRLLLVRAYHLPRLNWYQDWLQYMTNNHPIFGICWHHEYHPVRGLVRIISLIGSMLFGLAVTNIIYLAFVFSATSYDKAYVTVEVNATHSQSINNNVSALNVTNGNIALWTIGAFLNATFDNVIWAMAACTWCVLS